MNKILKNISNKLSDEEKKELINVANEYTDLFCDIFGLDKDDFKYTEDDEICGDDNSFTIKKTLNKDTEKNTEKDTEKDTEKENKSKLYTLDELLTPETYDDIFPVDSSSTIFSVLSDLFDDLIFTNNTKESENVNNKSENKIKDKSYNKKKYNKPDMVIKPTKQEYSDVKKRLLDEASEKNKEYEDELKINLVNHISEILEDDKTRRYKIYKKTDKNPAAAEIVLENQPLAIKDNIYILKYVEDTIKTKYDFDSVYIHTIKTDNNLITLTIYIILE